MKLKEWAASSEISYKTALRWFHAGILPVSARQLETGTIWVDTSSRAAVPGGRSAVIYARVSSQDQRKDLQAQVGRLAAFASQRGLVVEHVLSEVGSGLNSHRPRLLKLLEDASIAVIVIEHRDRLMRFGFECVEAALKAQGRRIVVLEAEVAEPEVKDDLVRDMLEILTSFCARLYGRRSARHRAQKAIEVIESHE